ncbi:MAG: ABC transporter permease [Pseudomonadota bacterium]
MATGNFRRALRQAMTVARRDFVATVFTPTFLIFLLSPLLTILFGAAGGLGASSMAQGAGDRTRIVVIAAPDQAAAIVAANKRLRTIFSPSEDPPTLRIDAPGADPAKQARALIDDRKGEVTAVLYGPLATPTILYSASARSSDFLAMVAEEVLQGIKLGANKPLSAATKTRITRTEVTASGHTAAAMFAVVAIFMMTLFLAGLTIGTMAEERNNKVIEVLAAAVPLESVFFGKLIGMFGVAMLFVGFWVAVVSQALSLLPAPLVAALGDVAPAVGKPMFVILFLVYFIMAFLLIGAAYLILGAQASTQRELQMMSLPLTMGQMAMVGLASTAAARPEGTVALVAEILPFSSPMAMAARAANSPDLWPHVLAIGWQFLWVAVVIAFGARIFRRGVLQSGSARPRRRAQTASA